MTRGKPTITPETPQPSAAHEELWSSDAIARMLQALDVPWVSLVPGGFGWFCSRCRRRT